MDILGPVNQELCDELVRLQPIREEGLAYATSPDVLSTLSAQEALTLARVANVGALLGVWNNQTDPETNVFIYYAEILYRHRQSVCREAASNLLSAS